MSVSRTDWELLVTEYKAVKKQLSSKNEAVALLQQQIHSLQEECVQHKAAAQKAGSTRGYGNAQRDRSSVMATKPKSVSRAQSQPSQGASDDWGCQSSSSSSATGADTTGTVAVSDLEADLSKLTLQHNEVVQEKRSLQRRLERMEAANKEKGVPVLIAERDRALKERNELVEQLEQTRSKTDELKLDADSCREELQEALCEKGFLSAKCDRLNKQLLQFLQEHRSAQGGDSREFIDIDAVLVENKYLKERLLKSSEEKQELIDAISKQKQRGPRLRQALRTAAADLSHGATSSERSSSSVKTVHTSSGTFSVSGSGKSMQKVFALRSTIADLQAMVATLSDSLRDKNTALQHSKAINKTLAQRILQLEKQLGGDSASTGALPTMSYVVEPISPSSETALALASVAPPHGSTDCQESSVSSPAVDTPRVSNVLALEENGDLVEWQREEIEADWSPRQQQEQEQEQEEEEEVEEGEEHSAEVSDDTSSTYQVEENKMHERSGRLLPANADLEGDESVVAALSPPAHPQATTTGT